MAAQIAGGLGRAAAVTVGGLIAADLGGDAVAGLPLAASVAGAAAAALLLAAVMRRSGRRAGLRLGWLVGAAGAVIAVMSTMLLNVPLLLVGMVLFGGAEAASSAARFAAADLPPAPRRGTAIGTVVFATAITATVGPNIAEPAAARAVSAGLPSLAGPFVVAAVAFAIAGVVLTVALHPDPLLVVNAATSVELGDAAASVTAPAVALLGRAGVRLGVAAAVVANFTMLTLMTVTPLHVAGADGGHGDGLGLVGVVISVHIGGMFAPAPLTGKLGDRYGHVPVVGAGAVLLAGAALLVAGAGAHEVARVAVALLMLGVGWNFAFVSGSALLTGAVDVPQRTHPRARGHGDGGRRSARRRSVRRHHGLGRVVRTRRALCGRRGCLLVAALRYRRRPVAAMS